MTTYLGKSCSFCLPRVPFVNCRQFMYLVIFPFGFEGRIWDLIVSVPDHCLSFYFTVNKYLYNFTALTPSHKLELFDKLVSPILNFGSEVWGFYKSPSIETVSYFPFGFKGRIWDLIVSVPDHCLSFYFTVNKYLYNFTALTPSHKLELFDKLVSPILNFGSEVWGFYKSPSIETVHLQLGKKI